jgi:PKD repeat protein
MHSSALNAQYPGGRQLHGYLDFVSNKTSVGRYEYIQFTAILPPNAVACFWDFGDGTTSNQPVALKNYTAQGTFTVKLIAIDANGNTSSVSKQSFVQVSNSITAFPFDSGYVGMSGTPKGVYSFRQYLSGVTYCVNLRRSADNATQDFGFTNQGYLDTASISAWAGASNVYVVKWYDQSGNADANQPNASLQPQLIIPVSGYAYLSCASTFLSINITLTFGPSIAFTMNTICASTSSSDTNYYQMYQYIGPSGASQYLAVTCITSRQALKANYSSGNGNNGVNSTILENFGSMSSITLSHTANSKVFVFHSETLQTPSSGLQLTNDLSNAITSSGQIGSSSAFSHYIWEAIFLNNTSDYNYIYNSQKSYYLTLN